MDNKVRVIYYPCTVWGGGGGGGGIEGEITECPSTMNALPYKEKVYYILSSACYIITNN